MITVPTKRKFRNKPVMHAGMRFDSEAELYRYPELVTLERLGEIADLKRQVAFQLAPAVRFRGVKRSKPALRMIVDFTYMENGEFVAEDVKSPATVTTAFNIKRHILLAQQGIEVRLWMHKGGKR